MFVAGKSEIYKEISLQDFLEIKKETFATGCSEMKDKQNLAQT